MTAPDDRSVKDVIASLDDEQAVRDCDVLVAIIQRISGHEPRIWNVGTIGFYPRKCMTTVYLMNGTGRYGTPHRVAGSPGEKHTTSRACVYIRRLADVDPLVHEQIVRQSCDYVKSRDGQMHRAME